MPTMGGKDIIGMRKTVAGGNGAKNIFYEREHQGGWVPSGQQGFGVEPPTRI